MIEFLSDIDTQLLLFFNGIHSPFWDCFMSAFTGKVIWVPMYASILYILLKNFHWKVVLCYVVAIALAITFADQMCNSFLRPLVAIALTITFVSFNEVFAHRSADHHGANHAQCCNSQGGFGGLRR